MATRLKQYSIPSFKTGLNTALPAHMIEDTGATSARNVKFSLLRALKTKGYEKFVTAAVDGVPQIIDNYFLNDGSVFLIVVTTTKAYVYNSVTGVFDDISLAGGYAGVAYLPATSDIAFDQFYFTNRNDYPQMWDGSAGTFVNIPTLDTSAGSDIEGGVSGVKAKIVRGFSNFLVLGNTLEDSVDCPSRVRWSKYGDPAVWINTAGAGQAGYADVGDVDQIVAMERLKDFLVIYKERSIWLMQYVGPPAIFAFRRVVEGIGAQSPRCIASLTNQHIFFGPDGLYSFDGISLTPLSDRIGVDFFLQLNNAKLELLGALFVEEDFEILFPFVAVAETYPTQALVYNYVTESFGMRDFPATAVGYWTQASSLTWDSFATGVTWDDVNRHWNDKALSADGPINLFADSSGFIYKMNFVNTQNGSDYEGYFTTKIFDLGSPEIIKRVQRVRVVVSRPGDYDLLIYAAALETPYDSVVFGDPIVFNLSAGGAAFQDLDLSGRYFVFKFRTANGNESFEIASMDIFYIERGQN